VHDQEISIERSKFERLMLRVIELEREN